MQSIKLVAELVWRQMNPQPNEESAITLEEIIEAAKHKWAEIFYIDFVQLKAGGDTALDGLIVFRPFPVERDQDGDAYITMDESIVDLPRDAGLRRIAPKNGEPFTKAHLESFNLFSDDEGGASETVYFRVGNKISFPNGVACDNVWVAYLSTDRVEEDTMIAERYGSMIHDQLIKLYLPTKDVPVDNTNDGKQN